MVFTNKEILRIAMEQSAIDANCAATDFTSNKNIVVTSKENANARKYLNLPLPCNLISYGNNIVASVQEEYRDIAFAYINKYPVEHCFEAPNMHVLNDELQKEKLRICFMAEYFLPDLHCLQELECGYELRVLHREDFSKLYTQEWSNALSEKRKELNVLGVGAYDKGTLVGLAACSADCDTMWQIGIDVLPEYRRKGIASALTSHLALEILKEGKVPFYCVAWSNIKSVRNAIRSGFRPAWVEMTAKDWLLVDEMNGLKVYDVQKKVHVQSLVNVLNKCARQREKEEAETKRKRQQVAYDAECKRINDAISAELNVAMEEIHAKYEPQISALRNDMHRKVTAAKKDRDAVKFEIETFHTEMESLGFFERREKRELRELISDANARLSDMVSEEQIANEWQSKIALIEREEQGEIRQIESVIRNKYPMPKF